MSLGLKLDGTPKSISVLFKYSSFFYTRSSPVVSPKSSPVSTLSSESFLVSAVLSNTSGAFSSIAWFECLNFFY